MQIHVINLDRDPDRYAETLEQFEMAGLGDQVLRFAAIDAQDPGFASPGYAPHSWRDRWELKRSEQAVFESHRSVWQRLAVGPSEGGVVCEDDILVSVEFRRALAALDVRRFGVVKLDGFNVDRRHGAVLDMNGWPVREITEPVPSAAGYAVSRDAARKLVSDSEAYCATLDDFVFAPRAGVRPVQIDPAVAVQRMCCQSEGGDASVREGRDRGAVARGPLSYRMLKEVRRGLKRRAARNLVKFRPALAPDLPPYRP
jgi:glycosyl transferase family 25